MYWVAFAASVQFRQFPVQYISGILEAISTGRKRDDPVKSRNLHVCPEVRFAAHFPQPVRVLPDAAEGLHIGRRVHLGRIPGEKLESYAPGLW